MQAGGQGTALSLYDNSNGNNYTNVQTAKVVNCTFLENTTTTTYQAADFFTISRSAGVVTLVNTADRSLNLNVIDVTGRVVYTGVVESTLSVSRQELGTNMALFVLSDGVNTKAQKVVL